MVYRASYMYVYANESSEGPENTDSESEWAQQKSACILNVLIRALHQQVFVVDIWGPSPTLKPTYGNN